MTKQEIRTYIRGLFASLDEDGRRCHDERICDRIVSEVGRRCQPGKSGIRPTVLLYSSLPDEVRLQKAVDELFFLGYEILLPAVRGEDIVLCRYRSGQLLQKGRFGIPEPADESFGLVPDIAFIPGRAFTTEGDRLGRGKGYYDRFLKTVKCPRIGVCYPFQVVDSIPTDDGDVRMDAVIF